MAQGGVYNRGWMDNAASIRAAFQDDYLIRSLKTRNATLPINHAQLMAMSATKWAYIITFGAYKIDEGRILDYFAKNETMVNRGRTKETFITAHNNALAREEDDDHGPQPINPEITDAEFLRTRGRAFVEFLLVESSSDNNLNAIDTFTTLYVAVAKRGNVTDDFITKITRGLSDDLQHDSKISVETINYVYRFYGGFITADNAQTIMDTWLNDIPEIALRVRLTLQQATNSGLTALVTCGRAIRKYPDFPWDRVNALTGGELANLQAAVILVDGNQYYGFNKSLGAARSTLYSSVAYIAKELLISVNGETSLRRYAGWLKAPKNAVVIKSLIDQYKQTYLERMESGEVPNTDTEMSRNLMTALNQGNNANLYA